MTHEFIYFQIKLVDIILYLMLICSTPFFQSEELAFFLIPSWSGVCEETAEVVSGSQPADQHQRAEGRIYSPPPELLTQPPGKCRGSGEQCSAQHTGPESQQPYGGRD